MRVVVKIPSHAYAELVAELERVPARERAERLRVLANIGLTFVKCDHTAVVNPELPQYPTKKSQPAADSHFRKIKERLQFVL